MSEDPRVARLLEEALNSDRPPESVCAEFPELLPAVRERYERWRLVDDQIRALFPPSRGPSSTRRGRPAVRAAVLPQIPGYDIVCELGHGGMGVVYRARHVKLHRDVALKMLLAGAYASRSELHRFVHEAKAVAGLQHPHIVQVHDIGDLEGRPYFTMELVEGGNLGQRLAGAPQPARQAAGLLATLAEAVDAAHRAGIVHRDLKPANVLLTPEGRPKVTDFGLARSIGRDDGLTVNGARLGTPSYMAPEQAIGKPGTVGAAADVHSLGAILYEMLTGRPPFRGESASETERQLLTKEPVAPSRLNARVPRDLETICLKCLRKEPSLRYEAAAALADDLRRFLDGRPILARPPGWAGRVARWARRQPMAAASLLMAATLVATAVGGGFWIQRQRAEAREADARRALAVEAAIGHAEDLQRLGHWPEARAALEVAPGVLGASGSDAQRQRLRRAQADADMVVRLEGIRLRLAEGAVAEGRVSALADQLYAEAFAGYGINPGTTAPADGAAVVRTAAIREYLLAFLHDWLYWAPQANRAKLRELIDAADTDPWRRAFREARAANDLGKLAALALALAPDATAQPPALLSGLSGALLVDGRRDEAWAVLRDAQRRHPGDFWINYLTGMYLARDRPQEAVGFFRAAVAIRPDSNQAYAHLSDALREAGDADGAIAAYLRSVTLHPSHKNVIELLKVLATVGRLEEGRVVWEKILDANPPDHDTWHGYAELCLYLGNEVAYRRVRRQMLDRFGDVPGDWMVAERTGLACLLLQPSEPEAKRVTAVAERAVAEWAMVLASAKAPKPENPFVTFVAGLARYRQGRADEALPLLREAAAKITDRAGPRLALAMAQFASGLKIEARQTSAEALRNYNWQPVADDRLWVSQVLRREAEAVILADLPPVRRPAAEPTGGDDPRLTFVGICYSKGLYRSATRLMKEAFEADPQLADESTAACRARAARQHDPADRSKALKDDLRYLAARCAALAGSGAGNDAADIGDAERAAYREHARQWLTAALKEWRKALGATDGVAEQMLTLWRADPDFAKVRDAAAVKKLPPDEQEDWGRLWSDVRRSLRP